MIFWVVIIIKSWIKKHGGKALATVASLTLASSMLAPAAALAADESTHMRTAVVWDVDMTQLDVSVPTTIHGVADAAGSMHFADNLKMVNNSIFEVYGSKYVTEKTGTVDLVTLPMDGATNAVGMQITASGEPMQMGPAAEHAVADGDLTLVANQDQPLVAAGYVDAAAAATATSLFTITWHFGLQAPDPVDPPSQYDQVVLDTVDSLSLKEQVCQLFCVYPEQLVSDSNSTTVKSALGTINTHLQQYPYGGACFFLKNIKGSTASQVQAMNSGIQGYSKVPMLMGVDEEGGRVQRIGATTSTADGYPAGAGLGTPLKAMGEYSDQGVETAKANAITLANNCKNLGFNWDFAPVADTDSNPNNPVIGKRAYSKYFNEAANLVGAAVSGFKEMGVACSLKHFPGHGDTDTDSHYGIASVEKSIETLRTEEFLPFQSGIAAGADSVMMGHLAVNSTSFTNHNIASANKEVIDILRNELAFNGVVVTDGMGMGAMTKVYGDNEAGYIAAAKAALEAGNDVLLLPGAPSKCVDSIVSDIENGTGNITADDIREHCCRVLQMKHNIGLI